LKLPDSLACRKAPPPTIYRPAAVRRHGTSESDGIVPVGGTTVPGVVMATLVLTGETISVRLDSKSLEVIRWAEKGRKIEERIRVPLIDIERVVLVGRPNVSMAVLQRLMFEG